MRLVLLFFVTLMVAVAYLTHLNTVSVSFFYTESDFFSLSVVSLALVSMSIGGLIVLLVGGVGELRALFSTWKDSREKKREERINSLYVSAVNCLTASRNKDAISFFKKILSIKPGHINSLVRLGNIYKMEGDIPEALRLHRRAKNISDENLEISFAIIDDFELAFRYEEAVVALNDIISENNFNISAVGKLRDIYVKKEEWSKAHETQGILLKMKLPDSIKKKEEKRLVELKYEVGLNYMNNENNEEARLCYKEVIKLNKQFLPAYIGIAETHFHDGKRRDAAEFLEKSYKKTGRYEFLIMLEDVYIELGEPEKVIALYQEEHDADKDTLLRRLLLGKFYFRLEMLDDAIDTLYSLSSEDHPSVSVILGTIYARRGEVDSAAEEFKSLLSETESHFYQCTSCKNYKHSWESRCSHCGSWNSVYLTPVNYKNNAPMVKVPTHH